MALGRRKEQQEELFVPSEALPSSPGHSFYVELERVLGEADFDGCCEGRAKGRVDY